MEVAAKTAVKDTGIKVGKQIKSNFVKTQKETVDSFERQTGTTGKKVKKKRILRKILIAAAVLGAIVYTGGKVKAAYDKEAAILESLKPPDLWR
jgi:hypothetical protein